jgi:hypothetical protein
VNLGQLTTRLNAFAGFDLSDSEACDLLNEARRRLARRSKYPRKTATESTVSGQAAYSWPEDMLLPLRVSVNGEPWSSTDAETVEQFAKGSLILQEEGVWYEAPDNEGTRALYLYPTPDEALTLTVEYVYRPVDLNVSTPAGEPTEIPPEFHEALLPMVAAAYYETVEDNPELAQRNTEKGDLWISELMRYDHERRSGDGIFRIGIVGVTA